MKEEITPGFIVFCFVILLVSFLGFAKVAIDGCREKDRIQSQLQSQSPTTQSVEKVEVRKKVIGTVYVPNEARVSFKCYYVVSYEIQNGCIHFIDTDGHEHHSNVFHLMLSEK